MHFNMHLCVYCFGRRPTISFFQVCKAAYSSILEPACYRVLAMTHLIVKVNLFVLIPPMITYHSILLRFHTAYQHVIFFSLFRTLTHRLQPNFRILTYVCKSQVHVQPHIARL